MSLENTYEHRYLKTGAFRTHFIEAGQGETLILVHGGGPGADGWGNWFSCLPYFERQFRTLAVDLAGYGLSEADPQHGYSQPERNEQLIAFIEALNAGPVSIVGNSMGGATGLGVAMKRPDLVKNLVLMGSAGLNYSVGRVGEAMKPLAAYDFTLEGMRRIVAALASAQFKPTPGMIDYRFELATRPERKDSFAAINRWIMANHGLHYDEAEIARVKTRSLIVGGKADKIVILAQTVRFLELLENSYGFVIPHCGHWAMLEHPQMFCEETIRFLKGY